VLVSTFVLRDARTVMEPLAARMDERPDLQVRLFVHVPREWRDTRHESELLREYAARLRSEWPGARYPEVYYDPRSLASDPEVRATWHAKCVVVDEEVAFLTSANFTEWAQQRNVEAGVVVRDRHFAGQLLAQFQSLVQARLVHRLPGF
jgi:phosphatidylserine/phosphatidylglycerophosphate/cardiolipin synthase-like enzyme